MANRIAGVCYVKADGKSFTLGGKCNVSPSKVEREAVVGLSGPAGYKETPRAPFVEIEVLSSPDHRVEEIDALTDATVTVELANGQTFVFRNAWTKGAIEVDAAEGKFDVRFDALTSEQI